MPHRTIFRYGHSTWYFKYMNHRYVSVLHDIRIGYLRFTTNKWQSIYHSSSISHEKLLSVHVLSSSVQNIQPHQSEHGSQLQPHQPHRNSHTDIRSHGHTWSQITYWQNTIVTSLTWFVCSCRFYCNNSWFQVEVR